MKKSKTLKKPFGYESISHGLGYTFEVLMSHLDALIESESGAKGKRGELAAKASNAYYELEAVLEEFES